MSAHSSNLAEKFFNHQGILLSSDGKRISYLHYKSGNDKLIVIVHGFYNSKDAVVLQQLAKELSKNYDIFMFDFRGHGKSNGLFSWTSYEGLDLTSALDFLKGKYKKIGIVAFSIGGSVSINVLSKDKKADSLICVSAPSEMRKVDYQWWCLDWNEDLIYTLFSKEGRLGKGIRPGAFWLKKEKPIETVSNLKVPVLYIHGDRDWVIRPWHSKALYEKTNSLKKMVLIKGGLHAEYLIRGFPDRFFQEVENWFIDTL